MTTFSDYHSRPGLAALLAISLCALLDCTALAAPPGSPPARGNKAPFHIEVQDAQGARVAGPVDRPASSRSGALAFDREYQTGDRIVLSGPARMAIRLDGSLPECLVFLPGPGGLSYELPYGREEKQTGSAYAPEGFAGKSHRLTVRAPSKPELAGYRNLALNPCDLPQPEQAVPAFFPHASSNSVSRSLFDFEARNAIDGAALNGHHGVWPY